MVGVALLLLSVAAIWWVERRLETADVSLESEVRSSERLLRSSGDAEVLRELVSDRSHEWATAQISLLESGLLAARPQLGLRLAEAEPVNVEFALAPNLLAAEVTADYRYLAGGDGLDSIVLRQTRHYRRSGDRWLLSPPAADYWGGVGQVAGRYVTVSFPGRDTEMAQRLAADLEAAVAGACARLADLDCPDAVHVNLIFSTDPAVLLRSAEPIYRLQQREEILMPTPTLVGQPLTDAGYRALFRGYARQVIAGVFGQSVLWPCCQQAALYAALLDWQLAELGLLSWPDDDADYLLLLENGAGIGEVTGLWDSTRLNDWRTPLAYSFMEYAVLQLSQRPPADMQRALAGSSSFWQWLEWNARSQLDPMQVEREWQRFLRDRLFEPSAAENMLEPTTS